MSTAIPITQILLAPISQPGIVPITHPTLDMFLLGFIAGTSLAACLFFIRFWRDTRDSLFLAFAIFFGLTVVNAGSLLTLPHPNMGSTSLFVCRLVSILIVIAAILKKNTAKS